LFGGLAEADGESAAAAIGDSLCGCAGKSAADPDLPVFVARRVFAECAVLGGVAVDFRAGGFRVGSDAEGGGARRPLQGDENGGAGDADRLAGGGSAGAGAPGIFRM